MLYASLVFGLRIHEYHVHYYFLSRKRIAYLIWTCEAQNIFVFVGMRAHKCRDEIWEAWVVTTYITYVV